MPARKTFVSVLSPSQMLMLTGSLELPSILCCPPLFKLLWRAWKHVLPSPKPLLQVKYWFSARSQGQISHIWVCSQINTVKRKTGNVAERGHRNHWAHWALRGREGKSFLVRGSSAARESHFKRNRWHQRLDCSVHINAGNLTGANALKEARASRSVIDVLLMKILLTSHISPLEIRR